MNGDQMVKRFNNNRKLLSIVNGMIDDETETLRADLKADRELMTDIKHRLESLTFGAGYGVKVELEFIAELVDNHLAIEG